MATSFHGRKNIIMDSLTRDNGVMLIALLKYLRPGGGVSSSGNYVAPYRYEGVDCNFRCNLSNLRWTDDFTGEMGKDFFEDKGSNLLKLVASSLNVFQHHSYWAALWVEGFLEAGGQNAFTEPQPFPKHHLLPTKYGFANDSFAIDAKETYPYLDSCGNTIMYETDVGYTEIVPLIYNPHTNKIEQNSIPYNRPLYNLPGIAKSRKIFIVGDVRSAVAVSPFWNRKDQNDVGYCVTTWPKGGVYSVDWSPIKNKEVCIVPKGETCEVRVYNPNPGYCEDYHSYRKTSSEAEFQKEYKDAMRIAKILTRPGMNNKVQIVDPSDWVDEFDERSVCEIVRAGHFKKLNEYIKANIRPYVK